MVETYTLKKDLYQYHQRRTDWQIKGYYLNLVLSIVPTLILMGFLQDALASALKGKTRASLGDF